MSARYKEVGRFRSLPIYQQCVHGGQVFQKEAPPIGLYKSGGVYGFGFRMEYWAHLFAAGLPFDMPDRLMECVFAMRNHKSIMQRRYFCYQLCKLLETICGVVSVDTAIGEFFFNLYWFYMQSLSVIVY